LSSESDGAGAAARALLSRIPSCKVVELDSGCCGMAGSFGYAKDHYEVSQPDRRTPLLPAARALKDGELLAAAGTSCRHQVAHFAGVEAAHPAVILHSLIE
jgi:Fe-S oxidoreductase